MTSRLTEEDLDAIRRLVHECVASILSSGDRDSSSEPPKPPKPPADYKTIEEWRDIVVRHIDTLRQRLGTTRPFHLAEARGILVRLVKLTPGDLEIVNGQQRWVNQLRGAIDPKRWRQSPFEPAKGMPRGWYRLRTSVEIAQLSLLRDAD